MTVVEGWFGKAFVSKKSGNFQNQFQRLSPKLQEALFDNFVFNSTARISYDAANPTVRVDTGNKTECALLEVARDFGRNKEALVSTDFEYVAMHTFSSARKRMSCVIKKDDGYRVLVKGASEVVLGLCSNIMIDDGSTKPLTEEEKKQIVQSIIRDYAKKALRTLCLAVKDVKSRDQAMFDDADRCESGLTCIGIVGIEDPVRPEVPLAIEKCKHAGIRCAWSRATTSRRPRPLRATVASTRMVASRL
jgi:Ca2+ transporting ATPase